ncbi:MAG TPA: tripartite tricarboxylate transporter substrate binding protein BugD [Pseudolabrys sp.]|jgi:tripartite-type tricarboxylate transporter receptor subunit TctC|nr:tripartite tricarboxylate transporter substrate binding protein BugD [Pseudolabrys sp.]
MKKLIVAALATALTSITTAGAETYPSRSITIIVPFSAGGPTDALARVLGDRMRQTLGQPIVVENVTGAGGTIGVGRAVHAAPDGYTLSIGHLGTHVVNGAIYPMNFDLVKDLQPVAMIASNPMMIVTKNDIPAKNLKELIAWIKSNDGKATAGTAGVGSGSHFSGVYLGQLIGAKFQFVPYRGTGPALLDLVAGQIDLIVDQASNSMAQVKAGKIRPYAITSEKRVAAAPDVPTVDEAGLPGFYVELWSGIWVPRGTPKDIIGKLNAAIRDALADPAVRKRLEETGLDIPPHEMQTPEALGAHQKAEVNKWWPMIKAANIKID